jgi:hypothetical protein
LFTHKSVPVIFKPPCSSVRQLPKYSSINRLWPKRLIFVMCLNCRKIKRQSSSNTRLSNAIWICMVGVQISSMHYWQRYMIEMCRRLQAPVGEGLNLWYPLDRRQSALRASLVVVGGDEVSVAIRHRKPNYPVVSNAYEKWGRIRYKLPGHGSPEKSPGVRLRCIWFCTSRYCPVQLGSGLSLWRFFWTAAILSMTLLTGP